MPRNSKARREERRQGAEERAGERGKRTPQEQLAELDRRLGKGAGAAKERAHLAKLIGAEANRTQEA